jgi:hypothetical protein
MAHVYGGTINPPPPKKKKKKEKKVYEKHGVLEVERSKRRKREKGGAI